MIGAATDDESHRDRFCRRYAPVITAFLCARWRVAKNHERVADATQEVFVQLFKPNGALQRVDASRPGGFRSYLYGVTAKVAANQERLLARQQRNRQDVHSDMDHLQSPDAACSKAFDRAWAELIVREAYEAMLGDRGAGATAALRMKVLKLRYQEGLPPREIAERLGFADVREVYQMLDVSKAHYARALREVVSRYHPSSSADQLDDLCRQLLGLL